MSTIFPFTQCINPTSIKMRGLSCVVTSRQVYLGIDIYPRSIFSFTQSLLFFCDRSARTDPLNTLLLCIAGKSRILRFNQLPLKSVRKLHGFMPFIRVQLCALAYGLLLRVQCRLTGDHTSLMITITATIPSTHTPLHLTLCAPYVPSVPQPLGLVTSYKCVHLQLSTESRIYLVCFGLSRACIPTGTVIHLISFTTLITGGQSTPRKIHMSDEYFCVRPSHVRATSYSCPHLTRTYCSPMQKHSEGLHTSSLVCSR